MLKNNPTKSIFIVIVIVFVVTGVYFYFFKEKKYLPTMGETRSTITRDAILKFTAPVGVVYLNKEDLPADLLKLIPNEAGMVAVSQLQDSSGDLSYKIRFEIDQNMHDFFLDLRADLIKDYWSMLLANRSDLLNVLDFENNLYQLRAEIVFVTNEVITPDNLEKISSETQRSAVTILIKNK